MKKWQRDYELEYLQRLEDKFSEFNECSTSGFSGMDKRVLANAMHDGHIEELDNSILCTKVLKASGPITADGHTVIGRKLKGDRLVEAISGDKDELIEKLKSFEESTWLWIWEEQEKFRYIAKSAGYIYIGSKVSSFAEIRGLYFKKGKDGMVLRGHPEVKDYEKLALTKLKLEKTYPVETALTGIKDKLQTLPEFTNHYSNYNKRGSWSAISLRGYRDDPTEVCKPIEMSTKWKKEHKNIKGEDDWEDWKLVDTPLREQFPEIETLMDLLPGKKHRIRLMKLKAGGGELKRHTDLVDPDQGLADGKIARIHFPVVTNDKVIFNNWDWFGNVEDVNMKVGEAWYLDVRKPHRAINGGTDDRIHIVVDVESNEELRNML